MVAPHHGGVWALVGGGGAAADPVVLMTQTIYSTKPLHSRGQHYDHISYNTHYDAVDNSCIHTVKAQRLQITHDQSA